MARKSKLRILCGRKIPKGELALVRDRMMFGRAPSTLAQRAMERAEAAQRMEQVDAANRSADKLRAVLIGIDPSDGLEAEIDAVDLQKSLGDASLCYDEVSTVASDGVGFRFERMSEDSTHVLAGSKAAMSEDGRFVFEHPGRDEVLAAVSAYLDDVRETGLPNVDALRERFGFPFPMPAGESPVDLQGKQMAKPILTALEDYLGDDRVEVLADAADLIGMHGISTNEARFLVESLNGTRPGSDYTLVTRVRRYDKIDELSSDGISCIGLVGEVEPLVYEDDDPYGIYDESAAKKDGVEMEV